jgi:hypothetical protein
MLNGFDGANSGGSWITGVDGRSVCVRSITRIRLLAIAVAKSCNKAADVDGELLFMADLYWRFVSLKPLVTDDMLLATVTIA